MNAAPRDAAVKIVRRLRDAGHIAYFAGGCVRDELLGLSPKDYDVATDARPDAVSAIFKGTREVGKAFGVMLVRLAGVTVEVSTFRREGPYSDRRRPDEVTFCDARTDASRRDFTINALFIDPLAGGPGSGGEVIDFVGGREDLRRRVLKAVGDPDKRLSEDHLRALRAVRFAARLGFEIDPATAEAVRRHARELIGVSRERVGDEVRLMLRGRNRARAARLVHALGLEGPVLDPDSRVEQRGPAVFAASVTEALPETSDFPSALAGWEIDRKDRTAGDGSAVHIDAIDAESTRAPARLRRALCLSNEEREQLAAALAQLVFLERDWIAATVARRKRAFSAAGFLAGMSLLRARDPRAAAAVAADLDVLAAMPGGLSPERLLSGDDLIAAGFRAGPSFGMWLERAYDEQLEGRLSTKEAALGRIREWAASSGHDRNQ